MRKRRFTLVFFVFLALVLFLTVPPEDVLETAYDESEVLPFESNPLISEEMPEAAASTDEAVSYALRGQSATSCRTIRTRIARTEARHSADVPVALLCTFLC